MNLLDTILHAGGGTVVRFHRPAPAPAQRPASRRSVNNLPFGQGIVNRGRNGGGSGSVTFGKGGECPRYG